MPSFAAEGKKLGIWEKLDSTYQVLYQAPAAARMRMKFRNQNFHKTQCLGDYQVRKKLNQFLRILI